MVDHLEQAINYFESQFEPNTQNTEMTLEEMKISTERALKNAKAAYRRGNKIFSEISAILRSLEKDLTAFFAWLRCLHHEIHGCSLCSMIIPPPLQ